MSQTKITVERVNQVEPHPNADRLDVIQVLGYKVVVTKGDFAAGDRVVYFPPDILIPTDIADLLGVRKYLKAAVYPGLTKKTNCRVGSCRLRGVASHGFVYPANNLPYGFGEDVTSVFKGKKYEPPVRQGAGDALPELPNFPKYTSIENMQRYPDAIRLGTPVFLTEKLHGTNVRHGLVRNGEFYQHVAGSHKVRRAEGFYWQFFDHVLPLLEHLSGGEGDVVIYGEIFGPGVQDLDYGLTCLAYRAFDISVDGTYLDYLDLRDVCQNHNVDTVPEIALIEYSPEEVEKFTDGPTTFEGVKSPFKGREGVVIRPLLEEYSEVLGGRAILKSVSADYRSRKNGKDIE